MVMLRLSMESFNRNPKNKSRICSTESDYACLRRVVRSPLTGQSRLSASEQIRISRRTNLADDCIAAFRARVPFARPTSFKILEIVSGARSVRVCVRGPTFAVRENTSLRVRSVSNVSIGDGPVSAERESHGFDRDGQRQSGQCQAALARANADIGATGRIRREQHA
jgi:hypothetical protein